MAESLFPLFQPSKSSVKKSMTKINACRTCKSKDIQSFFDLGSQPPANSLLVKPSDRENSYPLNVVWCGNCSLVQIDYTVDPKKLFSHYVWVTGTSKAAQEYSRRFYNELVSRAGRKKGFVLEVASNDGVFLRPFIDNNYKVLGVDPAQNIVAMAVKSGVPTICEFFGNEVANKILKKHGPAQMVFARHVFPHVANTHDFIKGLRTALADDGILAIEVHYAKTILDELHYDSIYHEHLCYFTLKSLEKILNDFGLHVFDLIIGPISGGALVVYAKKTRPEQSESVIELKEGEVRDKTNEFSSWKEFSQRAYSHREKLLKLLKNVVDSGGKVVGWGASARSSTMLNFAGIDNRLVSSVADLNPIKQNLYTAGTHILIDSPDIVLLSQPTHIFLMAWNFSNEIITMLKTKYKYEGQYIIPLPGDPKITS